MRTFERGVEGETQACGTGAAAVAIAAHHIHHLPSPVPIDTLYGDRLIVQCEQDGNHYSHIRQKGPATFLFQGEFPLSHYFFPAKVERNLIKTVY